MPGTVPYACIYGIVLQHLNVIYTEPELPRVSRYGTVELGYPRGTVHRTYGRIDTGFDGYPLMILDHIVAQDVRRRESLDIP